MDAAALRGRLMTRSGFVKTVKGPDGLFRVAGTIFILALLAAVGLLFTGEWAQVLPVIALGAAAGVLLGVAGVVRSRLALRRLHAAYLESGWVAAQAPSGLVKDSSGEGNGVVRRDLSLTSGQREHGDPIVIVAGRDTPPGMVEHAGALARAYVAALTDDRVELLVRLVTIDGLRNGADASTLFPVPTGMHLAVRDDGCEQFVVVIPTARRHARRHHPIKR